jgi:hypothetical protein
MVRAGEALHGLQNKDALYAAGRRERLKFKLARSTPTFRVGVLFALLACACRRSELSF